MQQMIMSLLFQSAKKYAKTITQLIVSTDIEQYSGVMFDRHGAPIHSYSTLFDKSYVKRVLVESEKLINRT